MFTFYCIYFFVLGNVRLKSGWEHTPFLGEREKERQTEKDRDRETETERQRQRKGYIRKKRLFFSYLLSGVHSLKYLPTLVN